ncbi:hypothetical protein [Streptomyces sviceus]
MPERRAIVHPPSETGGRPVRIGDRSSGTYSDKNERRDGGSRGWPP